MVSVLVKASSTVTQGKTVKFSADMEVEDAGADSDLWIGVAKDTITSGAAGSEKRVTVILPGPVVKMLVGTGDAPRMLRFYERCGFTVSHRVENFFIDHYDHPVFDCGEQLVDMVYLQQEL